MKKVTIKNLVGEITHGATMEEPASWIAACVSSNAWGLPERWVLHKDEVGAIPYDESHVLASETRTAPVAAEGGPEVSTVWVKLKATYTVEIEDITAEHTLSQVLASRKGEYPSPEEFMNAYFDGGQAALDALQAARLAVKTKYPKPIGT